MRVKICGITRLEDALMAIDFGADALGFVFYEKSPRFLHPLMAGELTKCLPPFVNLVGVFVDLPPEEVVKTCRMLGLDTAQLHGREEPGACSTIRSEGLRVVKAFRIKAREDLKGIEEYRGQVDGVLLDTFMSGEYGGTGRSFPWKWAKVEGVALILSGGLNPENVSRAIEVVRPYGVDVSSGVESSPGVKDHSKMRKFIKRAKSWRK